MAKKILIIDESDLLRSYLKEKLSKLSFEVLDSKDGVNGLIKMRNQHPDLIIMDFYLNRLNALEFLKEKQELKGTADIPIILLSSKMDRDSIIKLSKYKIFKLLYKPLEIDLLLIAVADLFKMKIDIDKTPCNIDVHLNDDILFIELADGFNKEKIELLKFKIVEIVEIYQLKIQKVLILFTNLIQNENLHESLDLFMQKIVESSEVPLTSIVILTTIASIKEFFIKSFDYKLVKVTSDFSKAIENFGKIDLFVYGEQVENIKKDLISSARSNENKNNNELNMKFSDEKIKIQKEVVKQEKKFNIAVVDDDLSVLEYMETVLSQTNWNVFVYENGKVFVDDLKSSKPDLIFLDLLMPKMSGFEVLNYLFESKSNIPVIVLTALADKNSIITARNSGVTSYLTKPVPPDLIIHKAEEILKRNF